MIEVRAKYEKATGRCGLSVKGHATGSEKVCAAVSSLVYALAGYLANTDQVNLQEQQMGSGDVTFGFYGGDATVGAFYATVIGLMQLAKENPDYIFVQFDERNL